MAAPAPPTFRDTLRITMMSSTEYSKALIESLKLVRGRMSTQGFPRLTNSDSYFSWHQGVTDELCHIRVVFADIYNLEDIVSARITINDIQTECSPDLGLILAANGVSTIGNAHESTFYVYRKAQEMAFELICETVDPYLRDAFNQEMQTRKVDKGHTSTGMISAQDDNFYGTTGVMANHANNFTNLRFASRVTHIGTLFMKWIKETQAPNTTAAAHRLYSDMLAFVMPDTMNLHVFSFQLSAKCSKL